MRKDYFEIKFSEDEEGKIYILLHNNGEGEEIEIDRAELIVFLVGQCKLL